jgi:hypothetical protein
VSDFIYRGSQLSTEATQWSVGGNTAIAGVDVFGNVMYNDALDGDAITVLNAGVGKSFADGLLQAYAGVENRRINGDDTLDVVLTGKLDVALSPTVNIARNTDESLYTYELNLSHSCDLEFATLTVLGGVGRTDITNSTRNDYSSVGAELSRSFDHVTVSAGAYVVDSDTLDKDTISTVSLTYKF